MAGKRILIVDGDPDSRLVYRILLQHHGYIVDEAVDGGEAERRLAATGYDVVVTELTLRSLDGHALIERLRVHSPELCLIVLTARSLEEDRRRAQAAGCARYLVKPLEPQQLLCEIRALTDPAAAASGARPGE
jgi:DNA-binding response OmpR family regulator